MRKIEVAFEGNSARMGIPDILRKHYEVVYSDTPQYVFCDFHNNEGMYYPETCIKIYVSPELPLPNFNFYDYAIGTQRINFGDRYFRYPFAFEFGMLDQLMNKRIIERNLANRKFCNFVYTNMTMGKGAKERVEFCKLLSKYKRVDCPGRALNNMKNAVYPVGPGWITSKLQFLTNYKFTIAFENDCGDGYVTEKMSQPLISKSVPIYLGDPNVEREFNHNAFINVSKFANYQELIDYIIFLDNNEEEYLKYLPEYVLAEHFIPTALTYSLEKFIVSIIDNGTKRTTEVGRVYATPYRQRTRALDLIKAKILSPLSGETKDSLNELIHDLEGKKHISCGRNTSHIALEPIENKLKFLLNYSKIFEKFINSFHVDITSYRFHMMKSIVQYASQCDKTIIFNNKLEEESQYREFLSLLWPHRASSLQLQRIGPMQDGAAVLLEPKASTVLSFGSNLTVAAKERDYALAEMGLQVLQFDAARDVSQKPHENIRFIKNTILPASGQAGATMQEALDLVDSNDHSDVILLLNHDSESWNILESLDFTSMNRFRQIHVVLRDIDNASDLPRKTAILRKICTTHIPVHFHWVNYGAVSVYQDFTVSSIAEVTFAKRDIDTFTPSQEDYPLQLDAPNKAAWPDLYLGAFSTVTGCSKGPLSIPDFLAPTFTLDEKIPELAFTDSAFHTAMREYPQNSLNNLAVALESHNITGKTVAYLGDTELLDVVLGANPARVIVFGGDLVSEDSRIEMRSGSELGKMKVDIAILSNYASRSGLGEFKDLNSDADFELMNRLHDILEPAGMLFLVEPVGADCLLGRFARIYGKLRLPKLLSRFTFLASYGLEQSSFKGKPGEAAHPVIVLSADCHACNWPANTTPQQGETIRKISCSGLFDPQFYIAAYPDILCGQMDAASHYVIYGARENRLPASWFTPDRIAAGMGKPADSNVTLMDLLKN